MKKILLFTLLFIIYTFNSYACHQVVVVQNSATENGDGTYTYEIEVCLGIEDTWGFYLDFTGTGNLVSYTTSLTSPSTGVTINASVPPVSGNGDIEYGDYDNTAGTIFSDGSSECFTVTLTFDDVITNVFVETRQSAAGSCTNTWNTTSCFPMLSTYTVEITTYSCNNNNVRWSLDGTALVTGIRTDGNTRSWIYCGDCASEFTIGAGAAGGNCDGGVASFSIRDDEGNLIASGGGDNTESYGPIDVRCDVLSFNTINFNSENIPYSNEEFLLKWEINSNDFFKCEVEKSFTKDQWEPIYSSYTNIDKLIVRGDKPVFFRLKIYESADYEKYSYSRVIYRNSNLTVKETFNYLGQPINRDTYNGYIIILYKDGTTGRLINLMPNN